MVANNDQFEVEVQVISFKDMPDYASIVQIADGEVDAVVKIDVDLAKAIVEGLTKWIESREGK